MNNFLSPINKLIKEVNNFFKINPHKHWNFFVNIFFIFVSALIVFSLYLLYEIKNEQIFQVKLEQQDSQTLLKDDALKNIIDLFNSKEDKVIKINSSLPLYSDPSL